MFEINKLANIFSLADILSLIAIIISIISVKIAKNSLVFSQRSMLIKESYEPILNDINDNQKIKFNTSKKMDFDQLSQITTSYVFLAFEEKDRKLIHLILELQENVNSYKEKVNGYASAAIAKVINEALQERDIEEVIFDVQIGGSKGPSMEKRDRNLYDLLLNDNLAICLETDAHLLWCEVGYNYSAVSPEGFEYESFNLEFKMTLTHLFEKYLGIKRSFYSPEEFVSEYEMYEKKIILELKERPEYKKAEKDYKELLKYMNELESTIIKRIKKLIIP